MGTGENGTAAGPEGSGTPETPGQLLGSGRDADVYAYARASDDTGRATVAAAEPGDDTGGGAGGGWVLRRYRDGQDARCEAAVMAYLRDRGYPVPELWPPGAGGPVRPSDLVMRRLAGPTLAASLIAGETSAVTAGAMLARLLRRLHEVPSRLGGGRILHLDLHPENVILTADGPVVIDWSTSDEGEPGRDRAMSALILAQVAVGDVPVPREAVRAVLAELLVHAPVSRETLAWARGRRWANPTMSAAELGQLDDAVALVRESGPAAG